jgi:uncharacterized pyridoxamine 5'-phosphate oxidase family protein
MHETEDDLAEVQRLLDESHASGGAHLRSIFTEKARIPASKLPDLLPGVQVLVVATVTALGEPRAAPVDGLFYRGRFWFGSSHASARFRHLRSRPQVSAVHVRGEELAIVVHGRARLVDLTQPEHAGFREYCGEVYGKQWSSWGAASPYARIDPSRMFTFGFRH